MKKQKGFSFIELSVAVFLAAFVIMGLISFLFMVTKIKLYSTDKNEDLNSYYMINRVLDNYLSRAVNVEWTTVPIGNIGTGAGKIREFSSSLEPGPPNPLPVGVFLNENGMPDGANEGSVFNAVSIYFKNPSPNTAGELYITTAQGAGSRTLGPSSAQFIFDNIVEFSLQPFAGVRYPRQGVTSVEVKIVTRVFFSRNKVSWRWCPSSVIGTKPECNMDGVSFKDNTSVSIVNLVNNEIETSTLREDGTPVFERLYGNLYFFKTQSGGR